MSKIIQPTYITKLPSTGEKVEFRPFTVKEEKALLLALQENNMETVGASIKNVISACTDGRIDPGQIPYYDTEFLFLQIRSKSVGEIIELVGSCECSEKSKTQFIVNIETTIVEPKPVRSISIKILDTPYTVQIQHPSIDDFMKLYESNGDVAAQVVANCIQQVMTDEEVMTWDFDAKLEFVDSMSPKQQKNIASYLKDMPMTKIPATYTCKMCSKVHNLPLSGISNFFL